MAGEGNGFGGVMVLVSAQLFSFSHYLRDCYLFGWLWYDNMQYIRGSVFRAKLENSNVQLKLTNYVQLWIRADMQPLLIQSIF